MSNLYNIKSSEQDKKGVTANSLKLTYEKNKLSLEKDEDNYIHMYLEAFSVFVLSKNERISNYNETIEKINMFDYYFDYIRLQEAKINLCKKLLGRKNIYEKLILRKEPSNVYSDENVKEKSNSIDEYVLNNEGYHFDSKEELNGYLFSGFNFVDPDIFETLMPPSEADFFREIKHFFDEIKNKKLNNEFSKFWNTIRIIGELD